MIRITIYALAAILVVVVTASYGSEVSQDLMEQFQKNPEKTCELIEPLSHVIGGLTVPIGAQHKQEMLWRATAPEDFHAVLALMQVVSVAPCRLGDKQEAKLFIRSIRLIEHDAQTGRESIVSEVSDFKENGKFRFVGRLFPRIPKWYDGAFSEPLDGMVTVEDGVLVIDLKGKPDSIYHGWTEPQVEAKPGMNYLVEMEVRVVGQARLQMGIDYWRSIGAEDRGWNADCNQANHCEGHLSRWFGRTEDWQTLRTPDSLKKR